MKIWRRIGDFTGGVALTSHKSVSSESPIRDAGIPPRLLYSLELTSGGRAVPTLAAGDYVRAGAVIALDPDAANPAITATSSGHIFFEEAPTPLPSMPQGAMIGIATDGLNLKEPFPPALEGSSLTPLRVIERLHHSGIIGMGGAGFPTARKISALKGPLKLLIINGAECEPFLTCDERVIRENTDELLKSATLLAQVFEIPEIRIAVESSRTELVALLQGSLETEAHPSVRLFILPDRYPAGGERQIIQAMNGFEIPTGSHPTDNGILLINAQTLVAAGRSITQGEPLTRRIVTVSGDNIHNPANLDTLIGTPIRHLIEACGGVKEGRNHLVMGGPMMGHSVSSDQAPVTKTTSALLVLAESRRVSSALDIEYPCIRCGACSDACPQGLLPQSLHDHVRAKRIADLERLHLQDCIECGCCDVVCPSHIPLTERFRVEKKSLWRYLNDEQMARTAQRRHEARLARLQREQKERESEALERKSALTQSAQPRIQEALERARLKRQQRQITTPPGSKDLES